MAGRPVLQRSINTEHAMSAPRPRLRGASHRVAALVTWPAGGVAFLVVPSGTPRTAVAALVVGVGAMFSCSALLHLRRWPPQVHERLFRLDHTGIYLAIGGTGTALALLGLEGWPRRLLLAGALGGTAIGILLEWLPFAPPRGLSNTVYLSLGWLPMVLLPWLWVTSGVLVVGLLLLGGVLYTGGAIIVAVRRPDPVPDTFGYHELFHALVIAAAASHTAMVALLVVRA